VANLVDLKKIPRNMANLVNVKKIRRNVANLVGFKKNLEIWKIW